MRIRKLRIRASILGITGLLLFVGLWKASGLLGWVRQGTMPDPFLVPGAFFDELESGRLWPAIASSLIHYCWGLAIGTFTGIAVGGFAATQRLFDELHAWLARILRPIPPLAWVVFAIAWFQVSHAGAAFVISIGVFWVNYFATYSAIKDVDPRFYELAEAFEQGSYLKRTFQITFPAAAPGTFAGIRTGVGQAWMTPVSYTHLTLPTKA